jgi:hypothetical protein
VNPSRPPARKPSRLALPLTQRLNTYALGACAAGVSLLALARPSEAEVVYTPAHVVIGLYDSYGIDLNHDGIVDYRIAERNKTFSFAYFQTVILDTLGNEIACDSGLGCLDFESVAALPRGIPIGSHLSWQGLPFVANLAVAESTFGESYYTNLFGKKRNRHYLPLRFQIEGETHYGWARLTIEFVGSPPRDGNWETTLTGYAYETIPNKSIISGQNSGTDDDRQSSEVSAGAKANGKKQSASLGTLALGKE